MEANNPAYDEFESLWQKAKNPQKEPQAVEVTGVEKELQVLPLLKQFSHLADCLDSASAIDAQQYDQMRKSIASLEEVIQAVDQQVLSDVLQSCKSI